jgi:hypothetical protein
VTGVEQPRVWRSAVSRRYYGQSEPRVYEAQLIQPGDVAGIEAVTILDEVLGLASPQYVLRQVCRPVRMDSLTARVDIATKLAGQERVPPLVEAELSAQSYTTVEFDLWKNVVHIAVSDEARRKAAHDILGLHASVAGSDWGNAANNPYEDIVGAITTIEGGGYPVDFVAADPLVWADFLSNPFVKGTMRGVQYPAGRVFPVPGLPGVTGYSDGALPDTVAYVGSRAAPALVFGEGPTEAARYRDEKAGYDAYVIRQWLQPELVLGDAIRELTGVHA